MYFPFGFVVELKLKMQKKNKQNSLKINPKQCLK